jgi:hypothetical protein
MSIEGPNQGTAEASRERSDSGLIGLLRVVSLVAVVAGAVGSLGLMFRAAQRPPRFLLVLFTIWVVSPFVALLWANIVSKRWSVVTRATLYGVTLVVALGSLAIYGELIVLRPPGSPKTPLFVLVPPLSCVFMAIVIPLAAWISRRRSPRSASA